VDASIESRLLKAIETLALEQNAELAQQDPDQSADRPLDPDRIAAIAARFSGAEPGVDSAE
jgi:hypothetical protein